MIKRRESQWVALFEAHERSGLSAAVFCKEHKLCPKYFSLRKKQLGYGTATKTVTRNPNPPPKKKTSTFIPAVVPAGFKESITLITGPVTLKIPGSVAARWLVDVIHGLRSP